MLFLYGLIAASTDESRYLFIGGIIGVLLGIGMGVFLYLGLARLTARHLFAVTGWLIALLAAGLAAQGAGLLVQADMLPPLVHTMWDTSQVLAQDSIPGHVLHTLIGYADRPSGIQVLFYGFTLGSIALLMWLFGQSPRASAQPVRIEV